LARSAGTSFKRYFGIATAQFEKFDEDGNLAPWEELSDTYILKLRLE